MSSQYFPLLNQGKVILQWLEILKYNASVHKNGGHKTWEGT